MCKIYLFQFMTNRNLKDIKKKKEEEEVKPTKVYKQKHEVFTII